MKTDSGYPSVFFYSQWQTLGIPSSLKPIGLLHESPPSPVLVDQVHGKRRDFSPQPLLAARRQPESIRIFSNRTHRLKEDV